MSATARPHCPEELRELAAYGPFAVRSSSDPTIVDRDAQPFFFQVPRDPDPRVRMRLAEAAALALNDGLRFPRPPIEAPLDPRHHAAVDEGSRGFATRVSRAAPFSNAAE